MGSAMKTCCFRIRNSEPLYNPRKSSTEYSSKFNTPKNIKNDDQALQSGENIIIEYENCYQLGEKIDEGPHGIVYESFDLRTGGATVTKIINCKPENRKKIFWYLDTKLFTLQNSILLPYLDLFEDRNNKGEIMIVSRLVSGCSLRKILNEFGSLDEKVCAVFVKQILEGLVFLNKNELIHSNLKSNNVFIESNGEVKLADFYIISQKLLMETRARPRYFNAPELLIFEKKCYKNDIWALGCLIIEMLSGQPAWDNNSNNLNFIINELKNNRKPNYPINISDSMKNFLDKCLEIDVEKRFSAEELLLDENLSEKFLEKNNILNNLLNSVEINFNESLSKSFVRKSSKNISVFSNLSPGKKLKLSKLGSYEIRKKNEEERRKYEKELMELTNTEGIN